ncbi:hypothetical protein H2509_17390 [Stappia sp. F7233]|uniref:Formyl transferase N-terminal domain-containing protein n=1 Tax=Stappia albiluteola TaxID=2758565 RepID=A0A839AJ04_9HYPH|nr:formyltransferase family protein [Stappia albiluteola]MBA5778904.1 hypothetical protein [Stappia albiluteola]
MQPEEGAFFRELLRPHVPEAEFRLAGSAAELSAVMRGGPASRLISFCSPVIVPPSILRQLPGRAYNFHPGPPERRGYRPAAFAAREKARDFGVTLHEMAAEVDSGPIVEASRFELEDDLREEQISIEAYRHLVTLARRHAPRLADISRPLQPSGDAWSGPIRRKRDLGR